jgi:Na+-transporting NADH:ubiquinone oxidoreductase subunit A
MDSEPLAADPTVSIGLEMDSFRMGLQVLTRLTPGKLWLCTAPGWVPDDPAIDRVHHAVFDGPHPAGLAGTHIHRIEPVGQHRIVWHTSYADVIAIGKLFSSGVLDFQRIIALGGQPVRRPRLLRARIGASLNELLAGEIATDQAVRIVSGSLLSGCTPVDGQRFLGRYHLQVSVVAEADQRQRSRGLWRRPGLARKSPPTTTLHGSPSGMLPLELFERILPSGFLAVPLLRALMSGDVDQAQALGCLELDEEDLALCAFLCPAKCDYSGALRSILQRIEQEG